MAWVEDIITGLWRIKWLFVIARNSSFTYNIRARASTVRRVGGDSACGMYWKAAFARLVIA
jgi:TolB-like protein